MTVHPNRKAFNFKEWIDRNQHALEPPVGNKHLFDEKSNMVVMIVGGPNRRVDFHDDPVEEFFYQLKGDILLKVAENGKIYDIPVREGEVYMLPAHLRHSPQRPQEGSVGLVVEGTRHAGMTDGFEWYCFGCGGLDHRVELEIKDITKDLPPLFNAFYESKDARTCRKCGTVHPGKQPPDDWDKI